MISVRSHGWLRDFNETEKKNFIKKNKISDFQSQFSFYSRVFNIRSTELNALIGISQIKK